VSPTPRNPLWAGLGLLVCGVLMSVAAAFMDTPAGGVLAAVAGSIGTFAAGTVLRERMPDSWFVPRRR
jgi:hypothetical protein